MKSGLFQRAKTLGAVLVGLVCVLPACAEHNAQVMYIAANMDYEALDCQLRATGGQLFYRSTGTLDIGVSNRYRLYPRVFNGMGTSEETTQNSVKELMLENNFIQIVGATIDYDMANVDLGVPLPQGQFVFSATGVESDGGTALMELEIIPPLVGEVLRTAKKLEKPYSSAQLIAYVTLEGKLQDGTTVHSNEFVYPITVCKCCLLFPALDDCMFSGDENEKIPLPCNPGQDVSLDCRAIWALDLDDVISRCYFETD